MKKTKLDLLWRLPSRVEMMMTCPKAPLRPTRYAVPEGIDLQPTVKFIIGTNYICPCFMSGRRAEHLIVGREEGYVLVKKSIYEAVTGEEVVTQPTARIRIFVDEKRVEHFYSEMQRVLARAD